MTIFALVFPQCTLTPHPHISSLTMLLLFSASSPPVCRHTPSVSLATRQHRSPFSQVRLFFSLSHSQKTTHTHTFLPHRCESHTSPHPQELTRQHTAHPAVKANANCTDYNISPLFSFIVFFLPVHMSASNRTPSSFNFTLAYNMNTHMISLSQLVVIDL